MWWEQDADYKALARRCCYLNKGYLYLHCAAVYPAHQETHARKPTAHRGAQQAGASHKNASHGYAPHRAITVPEYELACQSARPRRPPHMAMRCMLINQSHRLLSIFWVQSHSATRKCRTKDPLEPCWPNRHPDLAATYPTSIVPSRDTPENPPPARMRTGPA